VLPLSQQKQKDKMKTLIFKSEKNAKVYEIRSAKDQGAYKAGELVNTIKTDNINEAISGTQYEYATKEVK